MAIAMLTTAALGKSRPALVRRLERAQDRTARPHGLPRATMAVKKQDGKQAGKRVGTVRAVAALPSAEPTREWVAASSAVVVGRLLAGSTPIAPLVEFSGNGAGPIRARATVALDGAAIEHAVVTGQGA